MGNMIQLTVLLVLMNGLSSANFPKNNFHKNIVGGKSVEPNHPYNYIVSIRASQSHFCSGSIITTKTVLTAAHCLVQATAEMLSIVAGATNLSEVGQRYLVKKIRSYPLYCGQNHFNDIGLLLTFREIVFGPKVQPIKIYMGRMEKGHSCMIAGWGKLSRKGSSPQTLQELTTTTIDMKDCIRRQPSKTYYLNDTTQICAFNRNGTGACIGDSGGPFVCGDQLVGITSWGIDCGAGFPDVFTRIHGFLNWIDNMKE